jgi:hypothetical protein
MAALDTHSRAASVDLVAATLLSQKPIDITAPPPQSTM